VGRMITGEGPRWLRNREYDVREELAKRPASVPQGRDASDLKAKKAEQEGDASFADKYRKDDITRLGVRTPTDIVLRQPAAPRTKAAPAQEKAASTPDNESEMEEVMMGPPAGEQAAPSPAISGALANRKLIRNATV